MNRDIYHAIFRRRGGPENIRHFQGAGPGLFGGGTTRRHGGEDAGVRAGFRWPRVLMSIYMHTAQGAVGIFRDSTRCLWSPARQQSDRCRLLRALAVPLLVEGTPRLSFSRI